MRVLSSSLQKQILGVANELSVVASNTTYFSSKWEPNKLVITYLAGDAWRGFIRNLALPLNQVTTCNIRQTKTDNRRVMTGIATNAVFGQTNPYQNKECLAYDSWGYLYENGSGKEVGRKVSDG